MPVREAIRAVALWAVACATVATARAIESREQFSLPLAAGGTFKIDTYRGSLEVEEGDGNEVRVTLDIETVAETEADAARARANLQLHAGKKGNVAELTVRNPASSRALFVWEEKFVLDLYFRVKVPRGTALDLRVINGSITVGPVAGPVRAETREGNVFLRRAGGNADVRVESGEVIVSRCLGDLAVRAGQGLIRVGTAAGRTRLENRSGDVEVMMVRGSLEASAEAGSVVLGFPRTIGGPAEVRASGGNVYASIDPAASCGIEASARWGRVAVRLPFAFAEGADGARRVAGLLNGGGPLLRFRADGGDVEITRGATLFED